MHINPYLFFEGKTEEALNFYQKTIGAKVEALMKFKDAPPGACGGQTPDPATANKVMHASFRVGDSLVFASDGDCRQKANFDGFSLSLEAKNEDEAQKLFSALGEGGQVVMPLSETFFATRFGMLADRFGVKWMVVAMKPGFDK
jgi:PhnB protein